MYIYIYIYSTLAYVNMVLIEVQSVWRRTDSMELYYSLCTIGFRAQQHDMHVLGVRIVYIQSFVNNVEFDNFFREIILMHYISLVVRVVIFYILFLFYLSCLPISPNP